MPCCKGTWSETYPSFLVEHIHALPSVHLLNHTRHGTQEVNISVPSVQNADKGYHCGEAVHQEHKALRQTQKRNLAHMLHSALWV